MRNKIHNAKLFVVEHKGPIFVWAALTTVSVVTQRIAVHNALGKMTVELYLKEADGTLKKI